MTSSDLCGEKIYMWLEPDFAFKKSKLTSHPPHLPSILSFPFISCISHFSFRSQICIYIKKKVTLDIFFSCLFPQTFTNSFGYTGAALHGSTWSKTGSLRMIINIDPSNRLSTEWCERERGPYSVLTLVGSMSFGGSRMDGSLFARSVSSDRARQLYTVSTLLSSPFYFYFFYLYQ